MDTPKFYYLKTCDTCNRIMKDLGLSDHVILREIKSKPITAEELDALHQYTGSYESLLNKRARKYREQGLNKKALGENDIRTLILNEYTFLKRPVLVINSTAHVGNSKKVVEEMKQALHSS